MRYTDYLINLGILGIALFIISLPYFILNAIFNPNDDEEISAGIGGITLILYVAFCLFISARS